MKIFLSYSSKDRLLVEPIYLALRAEGYAVFFDRANLPAGDEYDVRIRQAIEDADLFIVDLQSHIGAWIRRDRLSSSG